MTIRRLSWERIILLVIVGLTALGPGKGAMGQQFSVIDSFSEPIKRGAYPYGSLVIDRSGNLYGTTSSGGTGNLGAVFKLTRTAKGSWTEEILYSFAHRTEGADPIGTLTHDASGNLYGTTNGGGVKLCADIHGLPTYCGTVFELSPQGSGRWLARTIHLFNRNGNGRDGWGPIAGLIQDANGNLYGTTYYGGSGCPSPGCGIVFELEQNGTGGWTEKIIHLFGSYTAGGSNPASGLVMDSAGNLYGTTFSGGTGSFSENGTVFELSPTLSGNWKETVLHNFSNKSTDGYWPSSGLTIDSSGNLYGTTRWGGLYGYGTVFELSPSGKKWVETILHNFNPDGIDGLFPSSGALTLGPSGNLYGATEAGGAYKDGVIFKLTRAADGTWTETILHTFAGAVDGYLPYADLAIDNAGDIVGTTNSSGPLNHGTVFEITP